LKCVGGSFGGNLRPTKFLCFTLKLLQLQPDAELVQEFLQQDRFKYVKALGAFYLRLTGRPVDIYEGLEPLYSEYSKLKYRGVTEWTLVHMDEFIDELLTKPFACGIALPRLPFRETLQEAGYLEEGPCPTALRQVMEEAGGLKEYLKYKVEIEKSPGAIAMWEGRKGAKSKDENQNQSLATNDEKDSSTSGNDDIPRDEIRSSTSNGNGPRDRQEVEEGEEAEQEDRRGPTENPKDDEDTKKRKPRGYKEEKRKKPKYGTLFKKEKRKEKKSSEKASSQPEEGSEEYWNEQRAKLGLKPLK
jgi:pre-mRNA-splicing factor 38A